MRFFKMHSLGNDFVVIDAVTQKVDLPQDLVASLGNRNTGIGFDQLLTIEPPKDPQVDFNYGIYNADGSKAQQCGNGTRAVALLVQALGLSRKPELVWESAAGQFKTLFTNADQIETTMTIPVLDEAAIPFSKAYAEGDNPYLLDTDVGEFTVTPVSMGNPHGVIFVDDLLNLDVVQLGSTLTAHPAFPEQANIGFCQVIDRNFVRLRVFERGAGETLACGTGACAAVVAAIMADKVADRVKVSLPGGKLRIRWPGPGEPITMTAGATLVFEGQLTVP